ncbi:MAG TPA: MauE/DoxX family redox-associated membrane protein [Planctomycetota bacterium]|nr:MauE/DoxX family redox-associated membrane protein [Planctomycetota bacterium]
MSGRAREPVLLILRLLLGAVLFYAGMTKIKSGWQFAEAIANYNMLPAPGNQILAVVLPWWEIAAAALLVFGVWTRAASLLALMLFTAFGIAVISALARGLDIQCGCFSDAGSRVGLQTLAIDVTGIVIAAMLFVCLREESPAPLPGR